MDRRVRARVLLAEAEALGVTIDDVMAAASSSSLPGSGGGSSRVAVAPTLAEYVDTVAPSFSANTAATYQSYWRVAVARFGDRPIDALDADDCEAVLTDAVRRAQQRRPGSDGRSSRENCVAALRALFGRAERAGLLTKNPARELEKPRRRASRSRALDDTELAEALDAVRTTSQDPDLDLLLVRFHLESGARREGALNLRLGDLDHRRSTVLLREKFGLEREQPVPPSLVVALEGHARARGRDRRPGLGVPDQAGNLNFALIRCSDRGEPVASQSPHVGRAGRSRRRVLENADRGGRRPTVVGADGWGPSALARWAGPSHAWLVIVDEGLEVDDCQLADRSGWSLLVVGRAEVIHDVAMACKAPDAGLETRSLVPRRAP
jgi:integrase